MEYENQYHHDLVTRYDCLLFDVDDTLYPLSSGLSKQCSMNIQEYMVQKLGIEEKKVPELNRVLYRNYGTSMAGLMAIGYNFDYDDYHSFVHGRLPYENLKPDPALRSLLLSLPIRKVIFSNADTIHVAKVLSKLGLEDCFDKIVTFDTLNPKNKSSTEFSGLLQNTDSSHCVIESISNLYQPDSGSVLPETPLVCKPYKKAFVQAFQIANINPQTTLFFDDSIRNIQTGKYMGLHTVLVGTSHQTNGVDYALESIHNIKEALQELREADRKSKIISYSGNIAIETSVIA